MAPFYLGHGVEHKGLLVVVVIIVIENLYSPSMVEENNEKNTKGRYAYISVHSVIVIIAIVVVMSSMSLL